MRRYFTDAKRQQWWIELDQAALDRARGIGVELVGFTAVDLGNMLAEESSPKRIVELIGAVQLAPRPQTFHVDVDTVVRGLTALSRALDDRFPGRHFYRCVKDARPNDLYPPRMASAATKA